MFHDGFFVDSMTTNVAGVWLFVSFMDIYCAG